MLTRGMFRFEKQRSADVLVVAVHGQLDAMTAGHFKTEVVAIAEAREPKVVVDAAGLTLIDSTGVGVLISLFKRVRAHGGQVAFAGLSAQPREIFRLLRLDKSLDLFASVADAAAQLDQGLPEA